LLDSLFEFHVDLILSMLIISQDASQMSVWKIEILSLANQVRSPGNRIVFAELPRRR
jgi:hypothetical protein